MRYRPTFFLKDTRQQSTAILCYVYLHGTRFRFPTGNFVKPSNWAKVKQRVRAGDPLASIINDRLDRIAFDLATIIDDLQHAGTLSVEAIRERWEMAKIAPEAPANFFDTYGRWIADQPTSPGTKRIYGTALNHLKGFADTYDIAMSFDTMNVIMWERFVRYLLTVQGMTNTSGWRIVKSVKTFLSSTHRQGLHTSDAHTRITKARLLPKGEDETSMLYLTESELSAVTELDLSDNRRLARVRDLFVFMCWTGLRFGDSQTIGLEHVHHTDDGPELKFVTGKNRKAVTTPLLPEAERIWQMYEGALPRITNQKGNTYLHEILQLAGIDTPTTTVRFRGTEKLEVTLPKHEVIGLHSAKRTHVTLSLLRGESIETLAQTTGNSVQTLRIYDVRTSEAAGKSLREKWK